MITYKDLLTCLIPVVPKTHGARHKISPPPPVLRQSTCFTHTNASRRQLLLHPSPPCLAWPSPSPTAHRIPVECHPRKLVCFHSQNMSKPVPPPHLDFKENVRLVGSALELHLRDSLRPENSMNFLMAAVNERFKLLARFLVDHPCLGAIQ